MTLDRNEELDAIGVGELGEGGSPVALQPTYAYTLQVLRARGRHANDLVEVVTTCNGHVRISTNLAPWSVSAVLRRIADGLDRAVVE